MADALTLRALNRATLARQVLLAREKMTALSAIERLVALQAQLPRPPFIGIWSRTRGFRRQDLMRLLLGRKVVRATTLRGTLHLMAAKDYARFRAALQPALTHGLLSMLRGRMKGTQVSRLVATARPFFAEKPRTFEEVRDWLTQRHPNADVRAMAYAVRLHLPLVQVPEETTWGYAASADFTLAEEWLGESLAEDASAEPLALRYLAAYGPATASDFQTWCGMPPPPARDAFAALRPRLIALRGERGKELFDLPKAPRPSEDAGAPVRFLPEFDNLVLSHADRRRFVADADRRFVYLPGLRVAATFLVDGFVAGTWTIERKKDLATLAVEPFAAALAKVVREELAEEGEALARFIEEDARSFDLRFAKPRR